MLTETWLNPSILNAELFNDNYVVYRRDREITELQKKKDGGGVLIAVSRKYNSQKIISWESSCEDLWVVIDLPSHNSVTKLALCGVYLPPPVHSQLLSSFVTNCSSILDKFDGKLSILGDFNLNAIDWTIVSGDYPSSTKVKHHSNLCNILIDFTYANNLRQCNTIKNHNDKVLDLVLTDLSPCTVKESCNVLCPIDPLHPALDISFKLVELDSLTLNTNNF